MWKTGYESLPSFMPRVERTTDMKCMQVFSSKGAELDLVRSCGFISGERVQCACPTRPAPLRQHLICCLRRYIDYPQLPRT